MIKNNIVCTVLCIFVTVLHHRRALRTRYLTFYFYYFNFIFINYINNLLLMHMSINCHLLTPRWQSLTNNTRTIQSARYARTIKFL